MYMTNLKAGIHTKSWGTVKINRHTEFEIRFTDPATGSLHPGVSNTIKNGSNLMEAFFQALKRLVSFMGFSSFRSGMILFGRLGTGAFGLLPYIQLYEAQSGRANHLGKYFRGFRLMGEVDLLVCNFKC